MLRECFEQYDPLLSSENPDDEEESNVKEEFLALIRQPVWDYLALNCPSFANRDSEAVFSEIFSCSIFDKLRMEEKETLPYFHIKALQLERLYLRELQ